MFSFLWLKQFRILCTAVATVVASFSMVTPSPAAVTNYVFADPTGFATLTVGQTRNFNFLDTNDLKVTLGFKGSEISLGTDTLDFIAPGTNNPSWMGGSRSMFLLSYDGSASGGAKEFAKLEFEFSKPLSRESYLVFTDFDSEEGLAIAAFDPSNNLIPFGAFAFARADGEQPGGASYTTPEWRNENPTIGWETNNTGWVGTDFVSGYIVDERDVDASNAAVYLQSSLAISKIVFYYNAETDTTTANNIRFNFAVPVPEPASMTVFAIIFAGGAVASRRKKTMARQSQ